LIQSKRPTRILLVGPSNQEILSSPLFLEVASSYVGIPLINPGDAQATQQRADCSFSITLAINKESMLIDPIDWSLLKHELGEWSLRFCPNLVITVHTDRLFTERTMRSHAPRATPSSLAQSQSVYQFFDPERPALSDINHLLSSGIPIDYAKLINKVDVHDRNLSLLGILPNQLRTLLKLN